MTGNFSGEMRAPEEHESNDCRDDSPAPPPHTLRRRQGMGREGRRNRVDSGLKRERKVQREGGTVDGGKSIQGQASDKSKRRGGLGGAGYVLSREERGELKEGY
ncbi:unnamed protein product [Pleuronectes platessa]|uniref:Uncharacterized protein n=1 Tax=Pleuronectes platessa TaxID=8262 RepID=A0A9N7VT12_PLEPL|nr:unnamed protein product [Pleuronectes platessa]